MVTDNGRRREAAETVEQWLTAEKENAGSVEAISDQGDKALTEKEKGTQGLKRSSCQYQKTGTEMCPEGDDKIVKTGYTGPEEAISDQRNETLIEKKEGT